MQFQQFEKPDVTSALEFQTLSKEFDPEIVILGGVITTAWDLIYPEIMNEIRSRFFF